MQLIGDDSVSAVLERMMDIFPCWLVMWGHYSREFWAYPRFDAPRGIVLHAADPGVLAGMMRRLQRAAEQGYVNETGLLQPGSAL